MTPQRQAGNRRLGPPRQPPPCPAARASADWWHPPDGVGWASSYTPHMLSSLRNRSSNTPSRSIRISPGNSRTRCKTHHRTSNSPGNKRRTALCYTGCTQLGNRRRPPVVRRDDGVEGGGRESVFIFCIPQLIHSFITGSAEGKREGGTLSMRHTVFRQKMKQRLSFQA